MKKLLTTMRDFSGGQLNAASMRSDELEQHKTGAAVMSNWLCETTNTLVARPGKSLVAETGAPRVEYARVGPTDYAIAFGVNAQGHGMITIYDLAAAAVVAQQGSATYTWTLATVDQIYFCVCDFEIAVCFPGMQPQLAVRAVSTGLWTFGQFAFRTLTLQSQQPFVRASVLGATMSYDALPKGAVTNLTCSQAYFTPNMVGRLLSILGQQVQITGVSSSTTATALILNRLPSYLRFDVDSLPPFLAGQVATVYSSGEVSATIEIVEVEPFNSPTPLGEFTPTRAAVFGVVTNTVVNDYVFTYGDILVSEMGDANINDVSAHGFGATTEWLEQFMGAGIGWPQACSYDRSRLIFFDFPQKPEAVLWSAVGQYDVFWVDSAAATLQPAAGTLPSSAILEYIPGAPRVRHVVSWPDEIVFTDKGIFEIPIAAAGNPLEPGSVEFRLFSNDGTSAVKPLPCSDSIIYVNAGGKRASAVVRTGAYSNLYTTNGASELYTDLFTGPVAMALAQGDGQVPERLIYILNQDGSVVIGRFTTNKTFVGWQPWTSPLAPSWIFCDGPSVYYCLPLAGSYWLAIEDTGQYLDAVLMPNAAPEGLPAAPAGKGPLWPLAGSSVTLTSAGADLGDTTVDANGNLVVPQGVDATSPLLAVGLLFESVLTPYVAAAQPGESVGQRQHRRKITRAMVTVQSPSVFTFGSWTFPPRGRDPDTRQVRPIGRSYDPAVTLTKTRPGPMRVVELSIEATI